MKKIYSLVFLVLLSTVILAGTISHTYHFSTPLIIQKGPYRLINFDGTMQTAKAGEPSLPYFPTKLLLPPGEMVVSMEIIRESEQFIEGDYQLSPYQPSRPLSSTESPDFYFNSSVYQSTANYPKEAARTPGTQFMNGFGFAIGAFTPINLIPATGKLSYFSKVTIVVHTTADTKALDALQNLQPSPAFKLHAQNFADNPDEINQYQIPHDRDTDQYKLLIITPEQFSDSFSTLTTMYQERGIQSQVTTTETILQNETGMDLQEKIRNYITDQYQNQGVEFVLLGGDVELVPYRGFYCYVQSGGGYQDNGIPSDLYYSALDGNWNDNGNNLWGEPDEDDLLPDVAVARFPFNTPDELENMVHKSLFYQNFPVTSELTNALMAGEHLYSNPETWGSDYLELLIGERSDNGYTTNGIPEGYNFQKLYEEIQPWSKYDLMAAINSGKQFVHHVGHASQTYVAYMTNSDITNANFSGANGIDHNYTLLQTHGCDCGAFDANDCILEKMVTIDNFAVAVMGNSRFGWFNEGQTEGPAAHLHREMMDALYGEEMRFLGNAFKESKIQTAPWVEASGQWEEGALRWNFYDLNTFGDPAMSVWTDEPVSIDVSYEDEIVIGSASTEVSVLSDGIPMTEFTCSVLKEGILCGTGITNTSGTATIVFDEDITQPGPATLFVAGRNSLPTSFSMQFIPAEGAYVVFSDVQINDESGNNNQLADYDETIMLTVTVGNVGLGDANNLTVTLSSIDPFVTITDTIENYGNVPSGQQATIENGFSVYLHDSIPDQHSIAFTLHCQTETDSWDSGFGITAQAPVLSLGTPVIFDATGGNNSGSLDPGETDTLAIDASNFGHSDCFNVQISLSATSPHVTINPSSLSLQDLLTNQSKTAGFEITIDENTSVGSLIEFTYLLSSGAYQLVATYYIPVGLVMEDFETGDFSRFEWQHGGNQPWMVSGADPFAGDFSAKSGAIGDEQTSELIIELEVLSSDNLTYWRKVSSEADYDYLRFYIDGTMAGEWAGEYDWDGETYSISSGVHLLKWSYEKDINTSGGADCAWLDNIVFPPTATILTINWFSENDEIRIYPNPANDQLNIEFDKEPLVEVTLYDLLGLKINTLQVGDVNSHLTRIDVTSLKPGIYLVEMLFGDRKIIRKVVIN